MAVSRQGSGHILQLAICQNSVPQDKTILQQLRLVDGKEWHSLRASGCIRLPTRSFLRIVLSWPARHLEYTLWRVPIL